MTGLLKLALGIWSWISRVLGAIGDWLRAPHDWWRIGFFCMGLVAMIASCAVWDRHNAYRAEVALRAADALTCTATIAGMQTQLDAYAALPTAIASAVAAENARLTEAQRQNAQALADLAAAQSQAAQDNAAWWSTYQQRPPNCQVAQKALDVACADVRGY